MMAADEGSEERRMARAILCEGARNAHKEGCSFDGWQEREDPVLIDAVSERDLDAIFNLIWKKPRR